MKYFFSVAVALLAAASIFAQTPDEILALMDRETSRFETEGFSMVMDIKVPVFGTFSTYVQSHGDKYKLSSNMRGEITVNWSDGLNDWEYDEARNEIVISTAGAILEDSTTGNLQMFNSVTSGYDFQLKSETADAWFFRCTKCRSNKRKDMPRSLDLVVSKSTFLPVSVKANEKGAVFTLRDFVVGVSEEEITFNPAAYPKAIVVDKR